jgi:hypothetical protein
MASTIARPRPAPSPLGVSSPRTKALEGVHRELVAEAVAAVAHMDLDPSVDEPGARLDTPAAVAQRVVEQVAHRLLRARGVGAQPDRALRPRHRPDR